MKVENNPTTSSMQRTETVQPVQTKSSTEKNEQIVHENFNLEDLREKIKEEMDELNQSLEVLAKDLNFLLHEESERFYVQVVNKESDQIIKELPPREFLDLIARLKKMVGVFLDEIA